MSLKPGFSRFLEAEPGRLHFAAHSHHPWPDVTHEAHLRAWEDAATHMDDKWALVFGNLIPRLSARIAALLGLGDPSTIVFAPNTHELVTRVASCLDPPFRVLTTDAEFHSFARQLARWEEAGLASADRLPAEPFDTFTERYAEAARAGAHDLVYLSQVFFDSGFVVPELDRLVSAISNQRAFVVIDGYHGFMALPTHLGAIQDRVFYLAGGYKYAMAGEGACFMHAPPGYGPRPVDTGWYAGFGDLERGQGEVVGYPSDGGRFHGATFDPSGLYRLDASLGWLASEGMGPAEIHAHARGLQDRLLGAIEHPGALQPPPGRERGNFLTFETEEAARIYGDLHEKRVITDYRGKRLRIGFGVYQEEEDVDRLAALLSG